MTHHYQRRAVVEFGDYQGDSYALCKIGAQLDAEYIAFCGVHFMAESAVILARPDQKVFLPNPLAGCPMADMAAIDQCLRRVGRTTASPARCKNHPDILHEFCR